mmetsp:Transcript_6335/g.26905  ORF Transcript_6335/g.26905 Transcript_6335/m.26905 type:complete len:230 (+) Transcript_6335:721-1410(+)
MSFSSSLRMVSSCVMAHCISFLPSTRHSTFVRATTSAVRRLPIQRFPASRAASVAWNESMGLSSRSPSPVPLPPAGAFFMEMFRDIAGAGALLSSSFLPEVLCRSCDATDISPTNSPASRVATLTSSPVSLSLTMMSTTPFLIRNTSSVARAPCRIKNSPGSYVRVGSFMPLAKSRSLLLMRSGSGRTLDTCFIQGCSSASFAERRFAGLYVRQARTKSRALVDTVSHS